MNTLNTIGMKEIVILSEKLFVKTLHKRYINGK